jgi:hypothetical protein
MAKVTVYVTDDQLERLRAARGGSRGGLSKAFQAFLENVTSTGEAPPGRYDYARKLMPINAAIERHRRRLARKVQDGGPPADGGPVANALTLLLYRELLKRQPDLEAQLEKEFVRFGLDELVATETEGVDLLAEPEADDTDLDVDESDGPLGFGFNFGDELRIGADLFREGIKIAKREAKRGGASAVFTHGPQGRSRRVEVRVAADDDPTRLLTVRDFETFKKRHSDWSDGSPLTPSQIETVRDLLRAQVEAEVSDRAEDAE